MPEALYVYLIYLHHNSVRSAPYHGTHRNRLEFYKLAQSSQLISSGPRQSASEPTINQGLSPLSSGLGWRGQETPPQGVGEGEQEVIHRTGGSMQAEGQWPWGASVGGGGGGFRRHMLPTVSPVKVRCMYLERTMRERTQRTI